jgi:Elongation complex protein 6
MALLVSACGFTEPRKLIVIKETCDIDGSFLISSLIGQRLRLQNAGIVLVCCHQTPKYYDTCGKKLGYNLTMSVGKKTIQVIEPLREFVTVKADLLMERLFDEICVKVKALGDEGKKNITLIIDDLTFFTNLGCGEKDLVNVGIKLHNLTQQKEGISVMLKFGLSDMHPTFSNNIEDFADVCLTLERLKSGDFWDVDGKLIIKKFNHQNEVSLTESERSLLYFIGDHNVKLSAPGEFGLKV